MNRNKILLYSFFAVIVLSIIIGTIIKIDNRHLNDLYKVTVSNIERNGKNCFLENVCVGEETTLDFLIEKEYVKREVNPKTNEYFSKDCVITYKDGVAKFIIK